MNRRLNNLLSSLDAKTKEVYYIKFFADGSCLLYNFSDKCIAECNNEAEMVEAIKLELIKFKD